MSAPFIDLELMRIAQRKSGVGSAGEIGPSAECRIGKTPRSIGLAADGKIFKLIAEGDAVDLSPLIREQIILALPTRPLCQEGCKGLCPQCGADRNAAPCGCPTMSGDPRLAVLRDLKVGH